MWHTTNLPTQEDLCPPRGVGSPGTWHRVTPWLQEDLRHCTEPPQQAQCVSIPWYTSNPQLEEEPGQHTVPLHGHKRTWETAQTHP